MPGDKEKSGEDVAKNGENQNRNIWRTDIEHHNDDYALTENPLEVAQEANRLAWAAVWLSVLAVVISIVTALINFSL